MVIKYKILDNNTVEDGYKIPDKDILINEIQSSKIFLELIVNLDFGK